MPHLIHVQRRSGKAVSYTPVYSPVGGSLSALDASVVGKFGGVEFGGCMYVCMYVCIYRRIVCVGTGP